ncbi:MAG: carbohydrate kinase [Planktotalea sp.]|uniref:carbohydrate kinase family protein n=1 Tax=Planktotalea sp. TaxID=2029877 RepID=UPI003C788BC9
MILNCGEALIDMVAGEMSDGQTGFVPHSGGAVMNTAVALGRLGVPSSFFAGLSSDLFGAQLKAHLNASHVSFDLCPISDEPTTLAFVQLENGQAKYAFFDENTALRNLALADIPTIPTGTKALFFGGISLAYGPCATTYEQMLVDVSSDLVTMLDPNIRPSFIRDETAFRARLTRMIGASDILKLSDEDLEWLEGEGSIADLAKGLLSKGVKLVLITQGGDGATAYHADYAVHVPTIPVDLSNSDTIGAGDTFNAGILASLHENNLLSKGTIAGLSKADAEAALIYGMKAARVTVSRKGANPPWKHELS